MTCIDGSLKCDGKANCKYRYDEDPQNACAPSIEIFIIFSHILSENLKLDSMSIAIVRA